MRPAGKREPAGRGRAKNEEKKRACFPYSFSHSLCSSVSRSRLVIVAVCGIPCRLACRLVPPSRSVVSFPVCFFSFPPWGVSLVVSPYLVSLFASRRLASSFALLISVRRFARPFVRSSFPHSLRSSSSRPRSPSSRLCSSSSLS